jgi:hypothetical protein
LGLVLNYFDKGECNLSVEGGPTIGIEACGPERRNLIIGTSNHRVVVQKGPRHTCIFINPTQQLLDDHDDKKWFGRDGVEVEFFGPIVYDSGVTDGT